MRIRKYDYDFSRRVFLQKLAAGGGAAGVLSPLWPAVAGNGDLSKAYPDELQSIELYTKGALKPGDFVTADNVEHVRSLIDDGLYHQIKNMKRRVKLAATTRDIAKLFPHEYLEATIKNRGMAVIDASGNVMTKDGRPWIGGNPFPDNEDGFKAMANMTLSWGRHNFSRYAIKDWEISPQGDTSYQYDFVWCEMNTTARVDGSIWQNRSDLLRLQSVWFTAPNDTKGSSFLNTWYYDQRKFPELHGYFPAFKRVRQFPTNQRFEPLVPGATFFLSDIWSSGDPLLTWGNYRVVARQPCLAAVSENWTGGRDPNWARAVHGGPKGQSFFDTTMELVPEAVVVEAEPTGYPRAPVSKKRVWLDARTGMFTRYQSYDRRGQLWKSWELASGQFVDGNAKFMDGAHPAWSWLHVINQDMQTGRISRFYHAKETTGGYKTSFVEEEGAYNKYLTTQALFRLGQ